MSGIAHREETTNTKQWRLKLRTILMLVNLVVLLLPLLGIYFFRIYENSLIRQTELELISQAAFVSSIYKQELSKQLNVDEEYGVSVTNSPYVGDEEYYKPILPTLSLSNSILPLRPDGNKVAPSAIDPIALATGATIRNLLIDAQRTTLSGIKILDYNGTVIAGRYEEGDNFSHLKEIMSALDGHYVSVIRKRISNSPKPPLASISRGTDIRVFIALPIIYNDQLVAVAYLSRTPQNILKHLWAERNYVLMVIGLLFIITAVLTFFTSYTIAKPIHALIKQTRNAQKDHTNSITPLKTPITQEIAELSDSFSEMTHTIKQRSEYIKQFAMHVSHEFKTPLTAIQGAIELLQDHMQTMTETERMKFLTNIENDTTRLKHLVTKLLELARADMATIVEEQTDIIALLNTLTGRYHDKGLDINYTSGEEQPINVLMPNDALETILTNLLDNSLQHDANHIEIAITHDESELTVSVHDNGSGISAANREKIFMPFFTTNREHGGTGLGLGIITSLLKNYHGRIRLGISDKGAEFILSLVLSDK